MGCYSTGTPHWRGLVICSWLHFELVNALLYQVYFLGLLSEVRWLLLNCLVFCQRATLSPSVRQLVRRNGLFYSRVLTICVEVSIASNKLFLSIVGFIFYSLTTSECTFILKEFKPLPDLKKVPFPTVTLMETSFFDPYP